MAKSRGKRDYALMIAVAVFGASVIGASLSLWHLVIRTALAASAEVTARDWAEDLSSRPYRLAALVSGASAGDLPSTQGIRAVRLSDASGRVASRTPEAFAALPALSGERLARARAGERTVTVGAQDGLGGATLAVVPVRDRGRIVAVAELLIDQAEEAGQLARALRTIMTLGGGIALLGLTVPSLILFLRLRDGHRAESRVRYLAAHDPLTGLPNRAQFTDELARVLDGAAEPERCGAVILVNVDRFRIVNETYGHAAGDAVLRELAERLQALAGPNDVVARLAVDEFALLADAPSEAAARALGDRVSAALARPRTADDRSAAVTVSLGVVLFRPDGQEAEPLLHNAGMALERAKAEGGDTVRFFEGELAQTVRRRRRLEHDLRIALATEALDVHYQPQFDLATGALKGCEALARWRHPALGVVPPAEFIPIAEETGLIALLGEWVMRRACTEASRWPVPVKLAVNLSPAQLRKGAVPVVQGILADTGLPASRLEIEITESLLLADTDATVAELRRLRDIGVSVAMDDFGTGYSSLSSLSRFPFSKIKIDKSFIQRLNEDASVAAIVRTIVGLGRALQVTITAEGVETAEQASLLRRIGCHEVQGYLYGRPMPAADFAARLTASAPVPPQAQVA